MSMAANEDLRSLGITECPECHYSTEQSDWEYVDFTSKTVAEYPQCHECIYIENIRNANDDTEGE